jgi:hypothetical protein
VKSIRTYDQVIVLTPAIQELDGSPGAGQV